MPAAISAGVVAVATVTSGERRASPSRWRTIRDATAALSFQRCPAASLECTCVLLLKKDAHTNLLVGEDGL